MICLEFFLNCLVLKCVEVDLFNGKEFIFILVFWILFKVVRNFIWGEMVLIMVCKVFGGLDIWICLREFIICLFFKYCGLVSKNCNSGLKNFCFVIIVWLSDDEFFIVK